MPNYATNLKWRFDKKSAQLVVDNTLKQKIKEALKSTEGKAIIDNLVNLPGNTNATRVKNLFYDSFGIFDESLVDDFIKQNFENIFSY